MFRLFKRWKRKRTINKVKQGDGHPLKPYRLWQLLSRSLFYLKLKDEDGTLHIYAIDVNYFSEDSEAKLYLDGKHHATASLPAVFPVPGGEIEVATSTFGLKRMHFVDHVGKADQLYPDSQSAEGLRMRFDRRFPWTSKLVGILAIVILLASLVLGLPQLIALISQIDLIEERWGSFESPIILPDWLNMALLVAGIFAALERALMLRNHWLIDMETSWWDD